MTTLSGAKPGIPARPTMRDVASLAGVGIKTVSRVVNGEKNVSAATTERVLDAVRALDFQPDVHAGNLRRADRRTGTLGLVVSSVDNPFSSALHRAVEDVATARGTVVLAASSDDDPERERPAVESFVGRRVDGLIVSASAPSQEYLSPYLARGLPMVFVDRIPCGLDADAVASDNAGGAAAAARHLLVQGHRRFAYLGDRDAIATARERRIGFVSTLISAGVPDRDISIVEELHDEDSARRALHAVLDSRSRPTAVLGAQNLVTIGCFRALRERGEHRRVALVGFDDFSLADVLDPAVTVVAQSPRTIGAVAARRVFARLDDPAIAVERVLVPTELIPRGSGEIRPE